MYVLAALASVHVLFCWNTTVYYNYSLSFHEGACYLLGCKDSIVANVPAWMAHGNCSKDHGTFLFFLRTLRFLGLWIFDFLDFEIHVKLYHPTTANPKFQQSKNLKFPKSEIPKVQIFHTSSNPNVPKSKLWKSASVPQCERKNHFSSIVGKANPWRRNHALLSIRKRHNA